MPNPAYCNKNRKHYRRQYQHREYERQEKQEVTVPFLTILTPGLDDCCPVTDDAIRKNKIPARLQPHDYDDQTENKHRKESDCYLQPRLPLAKMRPNYLIGSIDRKSTHLNSSHLVISYAVFCL